MEIIMKRNQQKRRILLIPIMIGILAIFLCAWEKSKESSPQSPLKFVTVAKDSDFAYLLHIYPHPQSDLLFIWTIAIKELSTGQIVIRQRAQTMRGQENELHRKYHRDGSSIKIKFSIHRKQPKLFYIIKRTRGDQVVYWSKGETKLEDNKKNTGKNEGE
jgi:hypothetical protein